MSRYEDDLVYWQEERADLWEQYSHAQPIDKPVLYEAYLEADHKVKVLEMAVADDENGIDNLFLNMP